MESKDLEKLGLDDKQTAAVLKLYSGEIDPIKSQLTDSKSELESVKQQVTDRDKQIKTLGAQAGNSEKLNSTIADLQATIKANDKTATENLQKVKTDNAVQLALRDAHARDSKAVLPFIDGDTIKMDKDGKLTGIDEQIKTLQKDHDYLFDNGNNSAAAGKPGIHVTKTGNPGTGEAGTGKADLSKMSYDEAVAYMANK